MYTMGNAIDLVNSTVRAGRPRATRRPTATESAPIGGLELSDDAIQTLTVNRPGWLKSQANRKPSIPNMKGLPK
jgi:hypothetical protein